MRKYLLSITIYIAVSYSGYSQYSYNHDSLQVKAHHTVYTQLLGDALLLSINYEVRLLNNYTLRVGFAEFAFFDVDYYGVATAGYTLNFDNSNYEFCVGAMFLNDPGIRYELGISYRYQPMNGGMFFKGPFFALSAAKDYDDKISFWFAPGLGVGYTF